MKDKDVVFSPLESVAVDTEERIVFTGAGEEADALAFFLDAQDVDDVCIWMASFKS